MDLIFYKYKSLLNVLNLCFNSFGALNPCLLLLSICLTGLPPVILCLSKDLPVPPNLRLDTGNGLVQNSLLQLTLPNDDDEPALGLQLAPDLLVALLVPCYLGCPEVGVSLGNCVVLAAFVAMPEAAMDEDDGVIFGEDNVRGARELYEVYEIAEAQVPQGMTKHQLWLR